MAVQSRIVLEPSAQGIVDATSMPPFIYELEPAAARKVLDDLQAAPIDKLPDRGGVDHRPRRRRRRSRPHHPARRRRRDTPRHRLHARRRLDPRQRGHPRPARPRARRRRTCGAAVRRVPQRSRGALPGGDRAGLRHRAVGRPRGRSQGSGRATDGRRRRVRGRQHGRRAHAHGQGARGRDASCRRPCTTRSPTRRWTPSPTTSSPRAITSRERRWSGSGTPTPRTPPSGREITASPNQATTEQLEGLPPTLLLVDEADPLRDEGEAYAAKLRMAGVPVTTVRYDGVVHDFMLLNAMSEANATRAAIAQATAFLRAALGTA